MLAGDEMMSVSQYVQDFYSYSWDFRGWLVLILIGFIAFFRSWSYIGLKYLNFQKR